MTTRLKTKKANSTKQSRKPIPSSKKNWAENKENISPFVRSFIKRIQNTAHQASLWEKKDSFILGVSGGPDSLCLLDVFYLLSKKYQFSLTVAHVNYGLRGKDSMLDEKRVIEQANLYRLPFFISRPKKKLSSEEQFRDLRYSFFESLRQEKRARLIAVAHTLDDQAETFLMRLLRGAGTKGLSSMQLKNGCIIRPLLKIPRKEILIYLKERDIRFRTDTSNKSLDFFRNRIRHTLLPLLEKKFQPRIKELLSETAETLSADTDLIENLALEFKPTRNTRGSISFSRKKFLSQPTHLQSYILRALVRPFLSFKNPSKSFIAELQKALKSTKNKHQTVTSRGLKFTRKGDTVTLLNSTQ